MKHRLLATEGRQPKRRGKLISDSAWAKCWASGKGCQAEGRSGVVKAAACRGIHTCLREPCL